MSFIRLSIMAVLFAQSACVQSTAPNEPQPHQPSPIQTADMLSAAMAAKRLCSALYVSKREYAEAIDWSATTWLLPAAMRAYVSGELEFVTSASAVEAQWHNRRVRSQFVGDQGCVILPEGARGVMFNSTPIRSKLPSAEITPWPMGDREAFATLEELTRFGVDQASMEQAIDLAFAEPADGTAAVVIVHNGKIVGERYSAGAHKDMQLESWSMGKSLTSALAGVLIQQGKLTLDTPLAVPDWHVRKDDPRAAITLRHALNMSSGLALTHPGDRTPGALDDAYIPGWADHSLPYGMAVHSFDFCASRSLEFAVGTSGRYRNCDPLLAGHLIKETLIDMGEDYLSWPQRALFDRIGIRKQTMETDVYGNFVLTGFDYGTPRNWARLGMLFLNRGQWQGEQIIPRDFVDFVSAPAPAWKDGRYGGLFWRQHPASPDDAYHMNGGGGQQVVIVPSKNLIMVRMGHAKGFPLFDNSGPSQRRNAAMRAMVAAVR